METRNEGHSPGEGRGHGFGALFVTNFFGVLNDNFLKTLAGFAVIGWLPDKRMQSLVMSMTAGALVLPYIFFSPLAERLAQVYSKKGVLRAAKLAELPIMAVAVAGFAFRSVWTVVLAVFLMGLQSSLYSPAKYALVRDIGGYGRISAGMGGMEAVAFSAILAGTMLASFLTDSVPRTVQYGCLAAFAAAGFLASLAVRADEERDRDRFTVNPFAYLRIMHRKAREIPSLNPVVYTLSVFWWAAASLQIGLMIYGVQVLGLSSFQTGAMLATAAVGITAGNLLAGALDKGRRLIGGIVLYGWAASAILLTMYFAPLPPAVFGVLLALLALTLGFFKLPLEAEIQKSVKGPLLNAMLAYANQVHFLFILGASATFALVAWAFGPAGLFPVLAAAFLFTPLYFISRHRLSLSRTFRALLRLRYDVRVRGLENIPEGGACLILPNHEALIDPVIVATELWRFPVRPLADESFVNGPWLPRHVLSLFRAVTVPDLRRKPCRAGFTLAKQLDSIVREALSGGECVLVYPSGHLTETGKEEIGTRQLAYNACRNLPAGVRVIGIRTHGLWGSIWSRYGREDSPGLMETLKRAARLLPVFLLTGRKRRVVNLDVADLTDAAREWASGARLAFNRRLEEWYNQPSGSD